MQSYIAMRDLVRTMSYLYFVYACLCMCQQALLHASAEFLPHAHCKRTQYKPVQISQKPIDLSLAAISCPQCCELSM